MSTVLIVVGLIVVFVIVVALVLYLGPGRGTGKAGLRRRFGPEYERALARHDGNTAEAEHELKERLDRHGALRLRPLTAQQREHWSAQWAGLQERFVESPREAVAQAERLIEEVAAARGFPAAEGPEGSDEQLDALSVHHAHQVDGYRRMRLAVRPAEGDAAGPASGTEELREVMVGARGLFEQLIDARPGDGGRRGRTAGRAGRKEILSVRPKGSGV